MIGIRSGPRGGDCLLYVSDLRALSRGDRRKAYRAVLWTAVDESHEHLVDLWFVAGAGLGVIERCRHRDVFWRMDGGGAWLCGSARRLLLYLRCGGLVAVFDRPRVASFN